MASPPSRGGDDDLTLRPHAAVPGLARPSRAFFGAALDLSSSDAAAAAAASAIPPSPLLRAALTNNASIGGTTPSSGGPTTPLASYLTPQTAALAAELAALAGLGNATLSSSSPDEVDAARDGAPPDGAPLHLVIKKVSVVGSYLASVKRERSGTEDGEKKEGGRGAEERDGLIH